MNKHELKLYVDRLTFDPKGLILHDISRYCNIPVASPLLQVLTPYASAYIPVSVSKDFVKRLNSIDLKFSEVGKPEVELPDGLYVFNYSVSPHVHVNTTLSYYRTTKLERLLLDKSTKYFYEYDAADKFGNLKFERYEAIIASASLQLRSIEFLISKYNDVSKALYFYERIEKLLNSL